jgi:hypothetical protein
MDIVGVELEEFKKIPGDFAWIALAAGIVAYDVFAIKTKKAETMSSAIWRSLAHPIKSPLAALIWLSLTWHLFGNKQARKSYKTYRVILKIKPTK